MAKLKIMIVDDDPDILELIRATLEEEYEVTSAVSGNEAIEKLKKGVPDLLVLDYVLPDLHGPEICIIMRRAPLLVHLPVLMRSGKGEIEDKV